MDELREALAAQEHARWSHWMIYMFAQGRKTIEGEWIMPASLVERWERQMHTPYDRLSAKEKMSDRNEAHNTLNLIADFFKALTRA